MRLNQMVTSKDAMELADTDTDEWEALASSMRKTLARNLDFALEVAGVDDGDSVKKMKLTDFSRKTKVARSTLTKLTLEKTSKGIQANPDLNTICRLAAAHRIAAGVFVDVDKRLEATSWRIGWIARSPFWPVFGPEDIERSKN